MVGASAAEQARRCLENLRRCAPRPGPRSAQAVRLTIYMTDLERFGEVNEVYGEFFADDPPARVTVGVAALPRGALVEIDAVVALGPGAPSARGAGRSVRRATRVALRRLHPPFVPQGVYHVELRHFPRNVCRFNLSAEELQATVLDPWVADRPFELGELRWDPRQARLMVLEGPSIPPDQLSMGRGWRTAQHAGSGRDGAAAGARTGTRRA